MNKKILFTIIFSATMFCCIAQDNIHVLDSVFVYRTDTLLKFYITRKPNGDITKIISDTTISDIYPQMALFNYKENEQLEWAELYWRSQETWKKDYKYIYEYDENGFVSSLLQQNGENDLWVNTVKELYANTAHGLDSIFTCQYFVDSNGVNFYQFHYKYDTNNRLTLSYFKTWSNNQWQTESKKTYTYNTAGKIKEINLQEYSEPYWFDTEKTTYTYISDTLLTEMLMQYTDMGIENYYRETRTYNADNMLDELNCQYWNINTWDNKTRELYTYDSNKRLETQMSLFWQISNWDTTYKQIKFYDNNDNIIEIRNVHFENGNWQNMDLLIDFPIKCNEVYAIDHLFSGYKIVFFYNGSIVNLNDDMKISQKSFFYPNPATTEITIKIAAQLNENTWLALYDVNGKLYIKQQLRETQTTLDISNLPTGVYIYKCYTSERVLESGKIMKN